MGYPACIGLDQPMDAMALGGGGHGQVSVIILNLPMMMSL